MTSICLTFSYYYSKIVIIKKEIRKGCDSYSEISLRCMNRSTLDNQHHLPPLHRSLGQPVFVESKIGVKIKSVLKTRSF